MEMVSLPLPELYYGVPIEATDSQCGQRFSPISLPFVVTASIFRKGSIKWVSDYAGERNSTNRDGEFRQQISTYSDTRMHLHVGAVGNIIDMSHNQTSAAEHMFLSKYMKPCKSLKGSAFGSPEKKSRVFLVARFVFSCPQRLKGLKIWNYNAGKEGLNH